MEGVLDRIHHVLAEEVSATVDVEPIPVEWTIAGRKMWFKDLYNKIGTEVSSGSTDEEQTG